MAVLVSEKISKIKTNTRINLTPANLQRSLITILPIKNLQRLFLINIKPPKPNKNNVAGSGIKTIKDLSGKRVGAARATTNLKAIQERAKAGEFKPKSIVVVETHPKGMLALNTGKVDAYSTDRSLLEGIRMKDKNPDKWMTVDFAIAYEPYAYIMREGNSDFRDFVNNTILWSIKTGKFYEFYEKWMGPKGLVPIKMSQAYKDYLQMIVYPIGEDWWKK